MYKKKSDKSWELDTCVILRERYYRQLEYLYLFMSISVIIYGSGFVPDWLIGLFKPIYKNKGNPLKRYGYTIILSCQDNTGSVYQTAVKWRENSWNWQDFEKKIDFENHMIKSSLCT